METGLVLVRKLQIRNPLLTLVIWGEGGLKEVAYSSISGNRFPNTAQFCLQFHNCLTNKRLKAWDPRLYDTFQMLQIKCIFNKT